MKSPPLDNLFSNGRRRIDVKVARLILDPPCDGAWNMAVDEALLRAAAHSDRITLRIYAWSRPTLSLGYFQAHADRASHAASGDCGVVRRASGGGAIVHDRELTYSLTAPVQDRIDRQLGLWYDWVHEAWTDSLRALGIEAYRCADTDRLRERHFLCFQRRAAGDLLLKGYKIGGTRAAAPAGRGTATWELAPRSILCRAGTARHSRVGRSSLERRLLAGGVAGDPGSAAGCRLGPRFVDGPGADRGRRIGRGQVRKSDLDFSPLGARQDGREVARTECRSRIRYSRAISVPVLVSENPAGSAPDVHLIRRLGPPGMVAFPGSTCMVMTARQNRSRRAVCGFLWVLLGSRLPGGLPPLTVSWDFGMFTFAYLDSNALQCVLTGCHNRTCVSGILESCGLPWRVRPAARPSRAAFLSGSFFRSRCHVARPVGLEAVVVIYPAIAILLMLLLLFGNHPDLDASTAATTLQRKSW